MEGFCRGCLLQFIVPNDLIQYTEKNRRLFVYSTGIQVKRNDSFTFQLCKECYFNMKQSCKFKKQCRTSEKKFKNYLMLKDGGDFESYIKNMDGNVSFRLPFTSGHSTPAHHLSKDDDIESTCTSIRNFMTDILEGEEMAPTEARIIREVIEEEADVLNDSLDSHWLQDDITIGSDFDGIFGISPFGTPRSAQNNICFTPRSIDEAKQRQINYLTSKEIIEKIDKPRISQKFHMPLLENMDLEGGESRPLNRNEIDEVDKDEDNISIKSYATDLHELDNSIPREVEDMVTENSVSNTIQCVKTDLLKDLPVEKQRDILENDDSSFVSYGKNIALSKVSFDNTITNAASTDNDMCIILSQGMTEQEVGVPLTKELDFYVNKAKLKKLRTSVKDKKEYHCVIDRNLDIALKNAESREFSLDHLIVTPAVSIHSAISTPTINNILFGDKDTETQPSTSTPIRNRLFGGKHTKTVPTYFPQVGQNIEDFDDDEISNGSDDYLNNRYSMTANDTIQITPDTDFDSEPKQEVNNEYNEVLEEFLCEAENDKLELNEELVFEIINPQELSKKLSDQDLFKRPLTPPSDKYDLDNLICRICNKHFTSCKSLKIHVAKKHNYQFPKTDKHRNNSHKSMIHICNVCGKEVKGGSSNFKRHALSHQKKKIQFFYCDHCPLFYRSRNSLVVHMKVHNKSRHFKEPKSKMPRGRRANIGRRTRHASQQQVYSQNLSEERHNIIRENARLRQRVSTRRSLASYNRLAFQYDPTANYSDDEHLDIGQRCATEKFLCNICGKISGNFTHHKVHVRRHIKEPPPIPCDNCEKRFHSKYALNEHIKTRHNGERYECKECPKKFKRRESLIIHMKLHLGSFDFKCDVCKVEYISKKGLAQHYASLKCIENRKNMHKQKSNKNEVIIERYVKGSLEKIKKMLCIETEDAEEIEEREPEILIPESETEEIMQIENAEEREAEISIPVCETEEIMQIGNAEEIEESIKKFSDTEIEAEISIPECETEEIVQIENAEESVKHFSDTELEAEIALPECESEEIKIEITEESMTQFSDTTIEAEISIPECDMKNKDV